MACLLVHSTHPIQRVMDNMSPSPSYLELISDWLRDSSLSGTHGVNLEAGHYFLGEGCAAEVLGQQIDGESERSWDPYTLKYTVRHLTKAGQRASPLLDQGQIMVVLSTINRRSHGCVKSSLICIVVRRWGQICVVRRWGQICVVDRVG